MDISSQRYQVAADVLATALEGGIGYWSLASDIRYDENSETTTYLGVTLHELEEDDDCLEDTIEGPANWMGLSSRYKKVGHTITLEDVTRAISKIAFEDVKYANDKYLKALCRSLIFDDPEDLDYDSDDADRIVQVAALGEVVYG